MRQVPIVTARSLAKQVTSRSRVKVDYLDRTQSLNKGTSTRHWLQNLKSAAFPARLEAVVFLEAVN